MGESLYWVAACYAIVTMFFFWAIVDGYNKVNEKIDWLIKRVKGLDDE